MCGSLQIVDETTSSLEIALETFVVKVSLRITSVACVLPKF
jgi:hypothetical protein